jgi:DNA-binding transcriptional ArsR family regulator
MDSTSRETIAAGTRYASPMTEANIAFVASLLADPSRAAMCLALAGGEARPAGELAARAGISAQTASNHLAKLIAGHILRVEQQGRWRYYSLAGPDVGYAVEALAVVAPRQPASATINGVPDVARRLATARTCYRHLAGRLGVALADALVASRWLEDDGRRFRVTPDGVDALRALGIDLGVRAVDAARRCIDWTERRPHVAGTVGTGLASLALERGWVRRLRGTRALSVTPVGSVQLGKHFNLKWEERA